MESQNFLEDPVRESYQFAFIQKDSLNILSWHNLCSMTKAIKLLKEVSFFDSLKISSMPFQYSMQSCSGKSHKYGGIVSYLIVEGNDSPRKVILKIYPVLECDNIQDNYTKIPTPEVARCYPHMQDIAKHLHALDFSMEILLLKERDLNAECTLCVVLTSRMDHNLRCLSVRSTCYSNTS